MITNIRLRNFPEQKENTFPWTLPLIKNFSELTFKSPITFFVGENGSGKSTILEAIAAALQLPVAGSKRIDEDETMLPARELADYFSISYDEKYHHGMLARTEDFIGFARKIKHEIKLLDNEIQDAKNNFNGGDIKLLLGGMEGEKRQLIERYGDLEQLSHGEGFIKLFNSRITGKGIYLIDEPEAALSPIRQLSLISLMLQKVRSTQSQFIIATHSPIIMSTPNSQVYLFENDHIARCPYEETPHYKITKNFLNNPETFLSKL